ncbi:MAG: hypothetical protein A3G25_06585 [Betaproteobacteria bacterium RIFCSPLOWO2_12_FULL_63_13]|nr:MAG: hypothetical protein A3H32_01165 [Betaproteobacteria bacterium RIFCSPLOWO2_02_FULL_63_19]OGA44486.1 MAG: hypothetical protein A3G25_06585 [Betaproteobacteria bacterium RIFCSPLOWO2_12_FULL_63_13]
MIDRVRQVSRSRTVTGFAHLPFAFIPGIFSEQLGMDGVAEVGILSGVAACAHLFARESRRGLRIGFLGGSPTGGGRRE